MYLLKGEIFKCIDLCKDCKLLYTKRSKFLPSATKNEYLSFHNKNESYDSSQYKSREDYNNSQYKFYFMNDETKLVLLKDVFLIFKKFNYEVGVNFINNLLNNNLLEYEEGEKASINLYYREYREELKIIDRHVIDKMRNFLNNPTEPKYNKIHIPLEISSFESRYSAYYREDTFIPVDDFIEIFYKNNYDKIYSDLKRINVLFS